MEAYDKYRNVSTRNLIGLARRYCHKYIRQRDEGMGCITCGQRFSNAGHFFSSKNYSLIRYHEDNIHGQCVPCNYEKAGNFDEYMKRLPARIGHQRFEHIKLLAKKCKRADKKWSRSELIEIIEHYKNKLKEL